MLHRALILNAISLLVVGCSREPIAPNAQVAAAVASSEHWSAKAQARPLSSALTASTAAPTASSSAAATSRIVSTASLPDPWRYAVPAAARGARGMVVTDCSIATTVGKEVLASGGNAVDAAIAVAFALAVAYPTAGNLGGGGFAITHVRGASRSLDFREVAPLAASRDMYLDKWGKASQDAQRGVRSAGVPGSVAGLWELYQTLGSKTKTWAELVTPAIRLARTGFVVDEEFHRGLERFADRLKPNPSSSKLFYRDGTAPVRGSTWRNPDLAEVLTRIAAEGRDGFYRGKAAKALIAQMKRERGWISQADLDRYQPKWREPLRFAYRGANVVTMPPPSSGGITLAMIANILQGFELSEMGWASPQSLHLIIEAMRRAFAARNAILGDPDFVFVPTEELMGVAWANAQRATITKGRATPSSDIASAASSGNGPHTTHFAIADAEGNAVALTTTLNYAYGSGVVVDGAGYILNNEMDDFAVVPGEANGFGLVQGEANAIAPSKRMLSSMSPGIVFDKEGQIRWILGAAGGPTIITAVFQQLSNVLDFGLDVSTAVAAPRLHMQHLPDIVTMERAGFASATLAQLRAMGHRIVEQEQLADAPMIGFVDSVWVGVAEPRRRGALAAAP